MNLILVKLNFLLSPVHLYVQLYKTSSQEMSSLWFDERFQKGKESSRTELVFSNQNNFLFIRII